MPFNPTKFKICAKNHIKDPSIKRQLSVICNQYEGAKDPVKKIEALRSLMALMDKKLPEDTRLSLMRDCNCLSENSVEQGKKILENANSLNEFIELLNKDDLNTGELSLNGKTITAVFKKCRCPSVGKYGEPFSPTFCQCSAGWLQSFFSGTLEQEVTVQARETILAGATSCRFEIGLKKIF